jgi:hypothetical protein
MKTMVGAGSRNFSMNLNIITELRKQAEEAWIEHFNFCSDQNVWKILNATLYDVNLMAISWKLRWIEDRLNNVTEKDLSMDWPSNSSHI